MESISSKVGKAFEKKKVIIRYAMNYGLPRINEKMQEMMQEGCEKILIFPMYPQYSATTTASVVDRVYEFLKRTRWQPTIRIVPPYFDDEFYIDALKKHVDNEVKKIKYKYQKIICSFHGIPKKYFFKG